MILPLLPSYQTALPGSSITAIGFAFWACLVGLGTASIALAGRPRSPSPCSSRRPPWPRAISPRRLERRILRAVVRRAVLDVRGSRLLPDQVEVVLAPAELHALGPLADLVAENVAHGMVTLVRRRGYRLAAEPVVKLMPLATRPCGRPLVLTRLGGPAALRVTGRPGPPSGAHGLAVLRRLEPPGRPLLLRVDHLRLGRPAECDLAVPEPAVSRRHASVHRRADGWYLLDHGSTNGTFLNGSRVAEPVMLADGDEIRLGRQVRLRFELSPLRAA
jgi:hypothetical protein